MRPIIFLDLDDTIFQTQRKSPISGDLHPVGFSKDGTPHSFMTSKQMQLFDGLRRWGELIPITARNWDSFKRVRLPFDSWSVLNFGGLILQPNREPEPTWMNTVQQLEIEWTPLLKTEFEWITTFIQTHSLRLLPRYVRDMDLNFSLVVKDPEQSDVMIDPLEGALKKRLENSPFWVHRNGNNLSVIPRQIRKECGVTYLSKHLPGFGERLTIGIGDSVSDFGFLQACDFGMFPSGSQLARSFPHSGE
jgi:hypothetical protein